MFFRDIIFTNLPKNMLFLKFLIGKLITTGNKKLKKLGERVEEKATNSKIRRLVNESLR